MSRACRGRACHFEIPKGSGAGGCKSAGVHGMQRFPRETLHSSLNTTQLKLKLKLKQTNKQGPGTEILLVPRETLHFSAQASSEALILGATDPQGRSSSGCLPLG